MAGIWCPRCAIEAQHQRQRTPIADVREAAQARGGILLSESFRFLKDRLRWRCGSLFPVAGRSLGECVLSEVCGRRVGVSVPPQELPHVDHRQLPKPIAPTWRTPGCREGTTSLVAVAAREADYAAGITGRGPMSLNGE